MLIIQDKISKSYTIDSANTWEKKTLIFNADTTGAFNDDNGETHCIVKYILHQEVIEQVVHLPLILGQVTQMQHRVGQK